MKKLYFQDLYFQVYSAIEGKALEDAEEFAERMKKAVDLALSDYIADSEEN